MASDQDMVYMQKALLEAQAAAQADEVPVGAVVVYEDKVIGRAHNQRELLDDPTARAEMLALTQAASYLGLNAKSLRMAVERGDVQALHPLPDGPWVFKHDHLDETGVRNALGRIQSRRKHPAGQGPQDLSLFEPST